VTRFNWNAALVRAGDLGREIAGMARERQPFAGVEERLLWYDNLPYLGLTRAGERRLLAALSTAALPENVDPAIPRCLANADALIAQGESLRALKEITRTYDAAVKVFEKSQA